MGSYGTLGCLIFPPARPSKATAESLIWVFGMAHGSWLFLSCQPICLLQLLLLGLTLFMAFSCCNRTEDFLNDTPNILNTKPISHNCALKREIKQGEGDVFPPWWQLRPDRKMNTLICFTPFHIWKSKTIMRVEEPTRWIEQTGPAPCYNQEWWKYCISYQCLLAKNNCASARLTRLDFTEPSLLTADLQLYKYSYRATYL